jgi:magnesium-transporting ATPase (P-type)
MNGKSFGVIRNEHADLLEKVIFELLKKTTLSNILFTKTIKIAVRGTVFGRMSPDQKQQLIETLQDLG